MARSLLSRLFTTFIYLSVIAGALLGVFLTLLLVLGHQGFPSLLLGGALFVGFGGVIACAVYFAVSEWRS